MIDARNMVFVLVWDDPDPIDKWPDLVKLMQLRGMCCISFRGGKFQPVSLRPEWNFRDVVENLAFAVAGIYPPCPPVVIGASFIDRRDVEYLMDFLSAVYATEVLN
jgi:hypothetical protein